MFFRCPGLMIITIASRSFQSCFIVQFWYGANTDHGVFDILFCSSLHLFCTIVWFFITGGLQRWLKSLKHFKKEFYRTFFYTIAQKQNISHCIFLNPKITHFLLLSFSLFDFSRSLSPNSGEWCLNPTQLVSALLGRGYRRNCSKVVA